MFGKFGKIVTLLSIVLMALVISFGFRSMSEISSGKSQSSIQMPAVLVECGRSSINFLNELGIDIPAQPTEIVKQKLQQAGSAVSDATKALTR